MGYMENHILWGENKTKQKQRSFLSVIPFGKKKEIYGNE